jgi:hypothetical protein
MWVPAVAGNSVVFVAGAVAAGDAAPRFAVAGTDACMFADAAANALAVAHAPMAWLFDAWTST